MSPVLELGKAGLWCDPAETKFVFALNQQRVGLLLGTWSNPVWGRNNQYWLGLYCILVHVFVSSKVSFAWLFLAVRVPSHFKRNGNFTSPDSDPKRRSERRVHQPTGSRFPGPPESHLLSATLRALFQERSDPPRRLSFGPDPPTIRHGSALCCGDSGLSIQMGRHGSTLSKKSNWQNPIPISPPTFATARVRTPHVSFCFSPGAGLLPAQPRGGYVHHRPPAAVGGAARLSAGHAERQRGAHGREGGGAAIGVPGRRRGPQHMKRCQNLRKKKVVYT